MVDITFIKVKADTELAKNSPYYIFTETGMKHPENKDLSIEFLDGFDNCWDIVDMLGRYNTIKREDLDESTRKTLDIYHNPQMCYDPPERIFEEALIKMEKEIQSDEYQNRWHGDAELIKSDIQRRLDVVHKCMQAIKDGYNVYFMYDY
jgi:ABC-type antimicrobial peptide transport system ATPase subunit